MTTKQNKFCEAAIDYVRRGISIIALKPKKKVPSFEHGLKQATTDIPDIRSWWEAYPDDNVAIVTGSVSGNLGVIDIDYDEEDEKDGNEFLHEWEREHGKLPETWTVVTARGGAHLYYRFRGEVPPNSTNTEISIDFRGEGGYVMAPPSIHPNGKEVYWDLAPDTTDLAWADDNVLAFLKAIRNANTQSGTKSVFTLPETIKKGERDSTLFKYACSLQAQGYNDSEITRFVLDANERRCQPALRRWEVDMKIRQALKYPKGEPMELKEIENTAEALTLELGKNGKPIQSINNCILAIESDEALKDHFYYDLMSYTRMVRLPLPWCSGKGVRPLTDNDYTELAAYLEVKHELNNKSKATDAAMATCVRHCINPLVDWLNGLKWDGQDRISTMFTECLGAENTEYTQAVAHLLLHGAVSRAFRPGCKFDYMPVIVGKQGLGKSYFISRLAMLPEWYLDNLNTFDGDAAVEKLRGIWIAEVAELTAMKRQKDLETIKAFVTTSKDTIRPKYARETEHRPRTCVMIGTTNDYSFLTDKTGNRRYLPIDTNIVEPTRSVFEESASYFEQLWAQAVHEVKTLKEPLVMPEHLAEQIEAIQAGHTEEDFRIGVIQEWLNDFCTALRNGDSPYVCIAQICECALDMQKCEYQGKRSVTNEIARIMANEITGWEKIGYKRIKDYGKQMSYAPIGACDFVWKRPDGFETLTGMPD